MESRTTRRARWAAWLAACLGAALLVGLADALSPASFPARVGYALAFLVVAAEILLAARLVPACGVGPALAALGVFGGGLWALSGAPPVALPAAGLTLVLLTCTSLVGAMVGARIQRPGHLLAVAAVSGLADLWSVYDAGGPTAQLVDAALAEPERLALFALPFPLFGAGRIEPVIGAGDAVFAALYLAAFERHGLATRRALWGLGLGFVAGLALLLALERSVPLLPLLGAGVVLADPGARSLERRELHTVLVVVVALLCLMGARLWG